MEHKFGGDPYTIGIEEELMILDAESLELVNAIESLLEPTPAGEIKPELMESVLEVSTDPCRNTREAGEQLRALRWQVSDTAAGKGWRSAPPGPIRSRGLASTRTPIFRAFPRVGIPPTYRDWEDYAKRIDFMVRLIDRMRERCADLGSLDDLEAVEDLLERGNGAARQVVVYEANHDLHEVMAEVVAATSV